MGILGKNIVWMEECESTNECGFKDCLDGNAEEFTVWATNYQSKGKGQRGNSWKSEAGKNLLFSFNIHPNRSIQDQFYLSKAVAIGIKDGLGNFLGKSGKSSDLLKIKWPNDIYWKDKKLGGILIENHLTGGKWAFSIIGIGLNINQENFDISTAESLKNIVGKEIDRQEVLKEILKSLMEMIHRWKGGDDGGIDEDYHVDLLGKDIWLNYQENFGNHLMEGRILRVLSDGKLELEIKNEIRIFDLKEISLIL